MISSLALVAAAAAVGAVPAHTTTLTTSLHGKSCKIVAFDRETGAATRECRGVHGYTLMVHDEDGRTSVDIVPRGGRALPLNFWDVVSGGYSTVGRKAQWHLVRRNGKMVPVGLVVMVNANEAVAPDRYQRKTLAAVTRIGDGSACVVYRIDAASEAAARRIRAAATNPRAACLGAVES